MSPDDELIDRHRGDDATISLPLRTALDLWMGSDGYPHDDETLFTALDIASRAAGFDGVIDAYHRCGPGVLSSADGRRGHRVRQ